MTLVIFDCDGVLVDSEVILIAAELEFLAKAGVDFERADYMRKYLGMPQPAWEAALHELLVAQTGEGFAPNFFEDLKDFAWQRFEKELTAVAGARGMIAALETAVCVASSSTVRSMHWKLDRTGLLDLFDPHLFSADHVEHGKPAPDLFFLASERMGVAPSDCIVVEDSCNGVIGAKRAGMKVIGFTGGGHCTDDHGDILRADGADAVVESYDALARIIGTV